MPAPGPYGPPPNRDRTPSPSEQDSWVVDRQRPAIHRRFEASARATGQAIVIREFDVRQYRRTIPGIASCGRTAPAAASSSSRHVSPIHGCGRGPDCIGCVERGVGVLGCSAISAWRSSSPTPRHLRGAAMENQQPNWRCRLSIMFLVTVLMLVWIIRRELGTDASR